MMDVHHRQDAARRRQGLLRLDDRPAAPARERDRADRHRPQVPEAHGVRAAQRVREPRARAEGRPRRARVDVLAPDAASSSTASARCSTLIHLKDERAAHRRAAVARPEAVARDRHAADAGPEAAAARRAGGRHDRRGDRAHRRAVPLARRQPLAGRRRARHEVRRAADARATRKKVTVLHEGSVLAEGLLADVQANEKVVEVYLGR